MSFGHTAKLRLPITIEDHPVDMTAARVGLPAAFFRGVEINVYGRATGIIRVKHGFDWPFADELPVDARDDPTASHIGKHLVFELSWVCAAFTLQVAVEPLLGDALKLAEEMELGVFSWVTPPVQNKVRCQLIQNLRRSHVTCVNEIEVCLYSGPRNSDQAIS